jgi:hypothetical protein
MGIEKQLRDAGLNPIDGLIARLNPTSLSEAETGYLDGALPGTAVASKCVVLDADKKLGGGRLSRKLYSIAAVSSDLSATTLTTFSNGSAPIAADLLAAGDTLRFRVVVRVKTVDGTDSLRIYGKYAGATIFDSSAVDSVIEGDLVVVTGEICTRTVHATTGTAFASTITSGVLGAVTITGAEQVTVPALSSLANAAAHTLIIQAIWGGAGNAAVLEQFSVYHN